MLCLAKKQSRVDSWIETNFQDRQERWYNCIYVQHQAIYSIYLFIYCSGYFSGIFNATYALRFILIFNLIGSRDHCFPLCRHAFSEECFDPPPPLQPLHQLTKLSFYIARVSLIVAICISELFV